MALIRRNKRLEKMPRKQHTGLYEVFNSFKKTYVKFNINLGAHIFHLSRISLLKVKKLAVISGLFIKNNFVKLAEKIHTDIKIIFSKKTNPFVRISTALKCFAEKVGNVRKTEGTLKAVKFAFADTAKQIWNSKNKFRTLVNYACPVIAFVFFVSLVNFGKGTHYGLSVECNGQLIGYVQEESQYEQAQKLMQDRITYVDGDEEINIQPKLSVQKLSSSQKVISVNELTDNMINHADTPVAKAYGLYINNKFIGASTSKDRMEQFLQSKLDSYKSSNPGAKIAFVDDVQVRDGLYLENGMKSEDDLIKLLNSDKQVDKYYTVQAGDSPTLIADKTSTPYSEIKALNPNIEKSLFAGDKILINKAEPFLSVKVTKTEEYDVQLPFETVNVEDSSRLKGTQKILVEGSTGTSHVTADVTYVDGAEQQRVITSQKVTQQPVAKKVSVGTKKVTYSNAGANSTVIAASGGGFLWPVGGNGGYVSSPYGYRGGSFHKGMDIAASYGTNVYASASGTVTTAGWYSGYGKCVIIDHGNGTTTLYGHNSSLIVRVGQYVNKGDLISRVGSTGDSTGNHCHFEIRIGGNRVNPASYVRK